MSGEPKSGGGAIEWLREAKAWARRQAAAEEPTTETEFSLVVPCYNVGRYIDDFLRSVIDQTLDLKSVQVILVDDGSTDETSEKARTWARRYPTIIECVRQPNQGLSAARNAGLGRARGQWISFPDPDDLLAPNYLEKVAGNIERFGSRNISVVACKVVHFYEARDTLVDDHVLTYRFSKGTVVQRIAEMSFIQLQVATAFFKRQSVVDWRLLFDARIRAGFEDAHFANRYLTRSPQDQFVVFAADAVYTYRKRATGDSLLDIAASVPEFWTSRPRDGWLDLLQDSERQLGHVPAYVARTVIYNLKGHLRILLDPSQNEAIAPELKATFEKTLDAVVSYLGADAIRKGAPAFRNRFQLGLLNRYGLGSMTNNIAYVVEWRADDKMARIEWFSSSRTVDYSPFVEGEASEWVDVRTQEHRLFEAVFYYSHAAWVRVSGRLQVRDSAAKAVRLRGPKNAKDSRSITEIELDRWTPPSRGRDQASPGIDAE